MSRILCSECGTKISDKATKCPHCGFQSADPKRSISEQDKYTLEDEGELTGCLIAKFTFKNIDDICGSGVFFVRTKK